MQFVSIDNATLAVKEFLPEQVNDKVPIVLLHDSLGCISVWKNFPQTLANASNRKCIVYDRVGYGQSSAMPTYQRNVNYLEEQADFFITLLDHLNIQHCIALGHSDGGSIALIAASKYPERFSAIITEGAHVFVEPVTLAGIRQAVHDIEHTDLKPKLIKHHGNKTNDVVLAWSTIWLSEPFIKWNIEHFLPQIKCPALILQGENDEFGTGKQVVAIEEKIPKAKSFIIPEAGHTPHKSHPEVFLNEVNHFLLHLSVD